MPFRCHSCVSNRYLISFMSCLGLLISVGYRTCFALVVTHIAKFNETSDGDVRNHTPDSIFPHCTTFNTSADRRVDWKGSTTNLFHTAFFAGQLVASIPAGALASKFSPKWIFGTTIFTTSVLFVILPKASEGNVAWIFVIRALQGIVEAIAVPAMNAFISSVASRTDRARLINIAYAGAYLSPALAMLTTGATTCYVGWDTMIYIYGTVGALWSILWLVIMENRPSINGGPALGENARLLQPHREPAPTPISLRSLPWRKFFTSLPMVAVWVASFCRNVIFAMLITEVQQYYKDVYDLSAAANGFLSAIPHICMALFMIPGSCFFDMLSERNILSQTNVRKLAQFSGYGVQGACFLAIGFVDNHRHAFALLCVGVAFSAFAISGFQPNPLDLAPQYAGALTGIVRAGMVGSVFITSLASQLTGHSHGLKDWQDMFIIAGSIHLGGVVFYLIFASGEIQPWAVPDINPQIQSVGAQPINESKQPAHNSVEYDSLRTDIY